MDTVMAVLVGVWFGLLIVYGVMAFFDLGVVQRDRRGR